MENNQSFLEIQQVLILYFEGVYNGNVDKLKQAFHQQALLFGDVNQIPYFKTLQEYLEVVKNRKSPKVQGEEFDMVVHGIEVIGNMAIAKVRMRILNYEYRDFLSLINTGGTWQIVNKVFINI